MQITSAARADLDRAPPRSDSKDCELRRRETGRGPGVHSSSVGFDPDSSEASPEDQDQLDELGSRRGQQLAIVATTIDDGIVGSGTPWTHMKMDTSMSPHLIGLCSGSHGLYLSHLRLHLHAHDHTTTCITTAPNLTHVILITGSIYHHVIDVMTPDTKAIKIQYYLRGSRTHDTMLLRWHLLSTCYRICFLQQGGRYLTKVDGKGAKVSSGHSWLHFMALGFLKVQLSDLTGYHGTTRRYAAKQVFSLSNCEVRSKSSNRLELGVLETH